MRKRSAKAEGSAYEKELRYWRTVGVKRSV